MRQLQSALRTRGELNRVHELAFEMELRMQEYVATGDGRARQQWTICCDTLLETMRGVDPAHTAEPETCRAILARATGLRAMFEELAALHETGAGGNTAVLREKREHLTGQMQGAIEGVVADAARLGRISRQRSMLITDRLVVWTAVGLVALAAFMLAIAWALGRGIVRPVRALHKGTAIVGSGQLDHRVGMPGDDEIGQLSRSFDEMVANLRKVTASRDELDREVAQRKEAEELMRRVLVELGRSNTDLERFAYSASHDLQEPLRKVAAFSSLLQKEYSDKIDTEGRRYMDIIVSATLRMQRLIDDLLTYARVTTRAKPFAEVDLNEVARDVISDLEVRIRETGGKVCIGELPTIAADPAQMRQLLQNLIGNALKFHRPGVPPQVDVRGETETRECGGARLCRITVSDNGVGFDEKYKDRIFGIFQRLHTRSEYEGSGIGLAVCKRIVERHNGWIAAESTPGQGARFTIVLPFENEERVKVET
jgi:signal transduction histidine kinase